MIFHLWITNSSSPPHRDESSLRFHQETVAECVIKPGYFFMWTLWLRTNNWALGSALWKVNLLRIRVKFTLEITFSIGCINISRRISRRFTHSIQPRVDYSESEEEKGKSIKCPTKNLYIDIWRCAQFIDNDDTSLPLIFNCFLQIALPTLAGTFRQSIARLSLCRHETANISSSLI